MTESQPPNRSDALPWFPTLLVGREPELDALLQLLEAPGVALITLTGPGGVGKTRLAVELAHRSAAQFSDGVYFVDLADLRDWRLVGSAIARALGVRVEVGQSLEAGIAAWLQGRSALLILDNFEHVIDAAPLVGMLLRGAQDLTILVTSRQPLRLSGEHEYLVRPLPTDADSSQPDAANRSPAFALFVERARVVRPDLTLDEDAVAAIEAIVHALDGLPLAIELAAARVRHLHPTALVERLERRLPLLTAGLRDQPERLQTMRNAILWSFDLLEPPAQRLLQTLAVFAGGFTLDAAFQVAKDEDDVMGGIATLVECSLLHPDHRAGVESRFAMLETIREFAVEQLQSGDEADIVRARHARWIAGEVDQRWEAVYGERLSPMAYLAWGDLELGNVRAALAWSLDSGEAETALKISGSFGLYWAWRGLYTEGRRWLQQCLAAGDGIESLWKARSLEVMGVLAAAQGDVGQARRYVQESLDLSRDPNDRVGEANALIRLGILAEDVGEYETAGDLLAEALQVAAEIDHRWFRAVTLTHLGIVHFGQNDLTRARADLIEAVEWGKPMNDPITLLVAPLFLGLLACETQQPAEAARWYEVMLETLELSGGIRDSRNQAPESFVRSVLAIGSLAIVLGAMDRAAALFGSAGRVRDMTGMALALPERAIYERDLERVRRELTPGEFDRHWRAGYEFAPDQVHSEVERLLAEARDQESEPETMPAGNPWSLSRREQEVLGLIVEGKSDPQIAEELFISPRTVSKHVENILGKMQAANRYEAAALAIRRGVETGDAAKSEA
jgi:predicted ATPase/DNA-binding CsgD family transcriptional regulator